MRAALAPLRAEERGKGKAMTKNSELTSIWELIVQIFTSIELQKNIQCCNPRRTALSIDTDNANLSSNMRLHLARLAEANRHLGLHVV